MVNIVVWSKEYVEIEQEVYKIYDGKSLIKLIECILDKAKYSGEAICLESAEINEGVPKAIFTEVNRW